MYHFILVALPDDTASSLLQITGSPRGIKVMQGNQTILYIGACTHFRRTSHKDSNRSGAHLAKQKLLLNFRICIVYKCDLFGRNPCRNQLGADVIVYVELSGSLV